MPKWTERPASWPTQVAGLACVLVTFLARALAPNACRPQSPCGCHALARSVRGTTDRPRLVWVTSLPTLSPSFAHSLSPFTGSSSSSPSPCAAPPQTSARAMHAHPHVCCRLSAPAAPLRRALPRAPPCCGGRQGRRPNLVGSPPPRHDRSSYELSAHARVLNRPAHHVRRNPVKLVLALALATLTGDDRPPVSTTTECHHSSSP